MVSSLRKPVVKPLVGYTTNYNLVKPDVGASDDAWGDMLNGDLDTIDSLLFDISTGAGVALGASVERVTVTGTNVLANLAHTPRGFVLLFVNGLVFTTAENSFSVSGMALTWLSTTYSINPGDTVVAFYAY